MALGHGDDHPPRNAQPWRRSARSPNERRSARHNRTCAIRDEFSRADRRQSRQLVTVAYRDTSAAMKLLVEESESEILSLEPVNSNRRLAASWLLCDRATRRGRRDHHVRRGTSARSLLGRGPRGRSRRVGGGSDYVRPQLISRLSAAGSVSGGPAACSSGSACAIPRCNRGSVAQVQGNLRS